MMCVVELYDVVFQDGTRQTRERLINCSRGTPTQPCRHARRINTFEERLASATEKFAAENQLDHHVVTSPKSERFRSRGDDRDKPKGLISSLFSAFKPASSKPVKNVFAENRRMLPRQVNQPTAIFYLPRSPTPPIPPQLSTSSKSPEIIPIRPQREHRPRPRDREREREARPGRRPVQLVELKDHSNGEDESPLPTMLRRHQREPRSASPIDRYEAEKMVTMEKERRRREERL